MPGSCSEFLEFPNNRCVIVSDISLSWQWVTRQPRASFQDPRTVIRQNQWECLVKSEPWEQLPRHQEWRADLRISGTQELRMNRLNPHYYAQQQPGPPPPLPRKGKIWLNWQFNEGGSDFSAWWIVKFWANFHNCYRLLNAIYVRQGVKILWKEFQIKIPGYPSESHSSHFKR